MRRASPSRIHPGQQGSLLSDAIAAARGPIEHAQGGGASGIRGPERIGLNTTPTRITRWRTNKDNSMNVEGEPFEAHVAPDGTIRFQDHDNAEVHLERWHGIPVMIAGSFDVTDAAMAAFGEVLYPYRKLKAMDQSRDARAAMAVRARAVSLQSALLHFRKDLQKIWNDKSISARERRAILFALWDECAEVGPEAITETASEIRIIIAEFIQERLPRGGVVGYSDKELTALNAGRSSQQEFAPYTVPAIKDDASVPAP